MTSQVVFGGNHVKIAAILEFNLVSSAAFGLFTNRENDQLQIRESLKEVQNSLCQNLVRQVDSESDDFDVVLNLRALQHWLEKMVLGICLQQSNEDHVKSWTEVPDVVWVQDRRRRCFDEAHMVEGHSSC